MPVIIDTRVPRHTGLNRTFYGIETVWTGVAGRVDDSLNRTFYGIETCFYFANVRWCQSLNRTFYGIETNDYQEDYHQ